jgi:hypothetical protein
MAREEMRRMVAPLYWEWEEAAQRTRMLPPVTIRMVRV